MPENIFLKKFLHDIKVEKGVYILATPIGNRYDITVRAIQVLIKSDLVICEDTRVTKKLFNLIGISTKKKWVTYNDHSTKKNKNYIINELQEYEIVSIVSDAGTPLISDPGYKLVKEIRKNGYNIFSIPGPCAAISALTLSGMKTDKFCFLGFLSKNKNEYFSKIKEYSSFRGSLIIYETAKKLPFFIKTVKDNFKSFKLVLVKEMTKLFEEIYFLTPENINDFIKSKKALKGEITIIMEVLDSTYKVYTDEEIIYELKRLKPSQVSAMLSKNSSESREQIYKRCMRILNDK